VECPEAGPGAKYVHPGNLIFLHFGMGEGDGSSSIEKPFERVT
jgi:hypothetical protein